jgi:flagellar biosynthesis anti-sigma factor FlgM
MEEQMNRVDLNSSPDVDQTRVNPTRAVERSTEIKRVDEARRGEESDRVSLSERATKIQELTKRARETADIREDKVEGLRRLVQSGRYDPSAQEIAEAIIRHEAELKSRRS